MCDVLSPVCQCSKALIQSFVPPTPLGLSVEHKSERSFLSRGSSSLKYTTVLPSSGVPILHSPVQVTDAVIKVQCMIHDVFSWQPVSRLVLPWPRREQPNEYQHRTGACRPHIIYACTCAQVHTRYTHTQALATGNDHRKL